MPRTRLAAFALLATLAACTRDPAPPGEGTTPAPAGPAAPAAGGTVPAPGPIPLERFRAEPYSYTHNSGFETAERLVIRDSTAWAAAWARLNAGGSPRPLPAVDFSGQWVLLVALGQRATGGYGILLDSAVATPDSIIVHVRATSPGPRCGTTSALSEPVDLARIPRIERPVAFRVREVVTDCP